MPETLSKIINQLKDFWKELDGSQKKRIYITSAILSIAIIISIIFVSRPNYTVLISGRQERSRRNGINPGRKQYQVQN